jgi:hypothetical protein
MDDEASEGDAGLLDGQEDAILELFRRHGYAGPLLVVDDQPDEAVFLVPSAALLAIRATALIEGLQALLQRKVFVVDASPVWTTKARSIG